MNKTRTGIFENTDTITLVSGFGANLLTLQKFVVTNTDTANITPKIRLHNILNVGDDDEYIEIVPEIELSPGQRLEYTSPLMFFANQNLEIELSTNVETKQPQYIMVTSDG
jgi:hypothetical protein|tara:strand:- start:267 stop:599 length:333 start_codon:yes stop_codon:yes gene_type:complete